jgi:succinate dehydrogenase/fumarate reductase flavoprotein subunit
VQRLPSWFSLQRKIAEQQEERMSKQSKFGRLSRRNILAGLGLGAGAASVSSLRSAQAGLLPAGRRTEKCDVVVIGTGMTGTAASLQAKSDGGDVIVLEKMPERRNSGNSRLAAGYFAIPSADSIEARNQYLEDLTHKSQGRGNIEIYRVLTDHVLEGVAWMKEHGVQLLPTIPQAPYRLSVAIAAPGAYVGMPNLLGTLRQRFVDRGGRIAYETKAKQLIMSDQGRVVGVRAIGSDGVVDYLANAVVIAAGGYAGNRLILEGFVDPAAGAMMVRGTPWATGDGLLMAQEAGAGLANMAGLTSLHIAAVSPKETSAGNPFQALPYCLAINREGKRYIDESRGYVANGKATLKQTGQSTALIFDEEIKKLRDVATSISVFQRLGVPIAEANSIEELAGKIGVPAAELVATVTAFNDAVKDGAAPGANPPKATLARKIEVAKFYAFQPLVPGITLSFGGITINSNAQALEPDGRVIPGLYAAGEGAGALYYDDYVGGTSLANCLVMGRIAGSQAARERHV